LNQVTARHALLALLVASPGARRRGCRTFFAAFLAVVAGMLLVITAVASRWPRVPTHLRCAAAATIALAVMGIGGLVGGYLFAVLCGLLLGSPAALVADRRLLRSSGKRLPWQGGAVGAFAGTGAVMLGGLLWLFGIGIAAFAIAVVLIAAVAYAGERWRAPRRLPGDAPA
jgi:hypothetical protein